jgi:hypothetical protein
MAVTRKSFAAKTPKPLAPIDRIIAVYRAADRLVLTLPDPAERAIAVEMLRERYPAPKKPE